ncbi:antibiotic biosynthesis monooxygenase family protein [Streptomyces sp. NPDC059743]|uniref:antibiotic biosynthesis monooxygenase family protein n=1 Tax=Streptomyces sp. NPDC059743 TaxID=3346928 RepID=UPI00365AC290
MTPSTERARTGRDTTRDMPDVRRGDAAGVFVSHWYVRDGAAGTAALQEVVARWSRSPRPPGALSLSTFVSTDDTTVLTYTQCDGPDAYRRYLETLTGVGVAAVEYRVCRCVLLDTTSRVPGCVVVAMFDVDGPECQERIIGSIAQAVEETPVERHPGLLSANFHASEDGTRVLNYAEWTTEEAHLAFLAGATHVTTRRVTDDTPGVRPVGFKRYRLHRSLGV